MGNQKSTASGNSGGGKKTKQVPASSKDVQPRRRVDISMVQDVLLIWMDNKIDEGNDECRNTLSQLRRIVNAVNTFTDGDQCVTFLSEINDNKVCMIISGSLGKQIVPVVHDMSQVDSIFIFCGNKKHHEQWAKEWPKIKGVSTEITPMCEVLKIAARECEHNAIGISFMATIGTGVFKENLNQLNCSFMYTQILKEILLTIEFNEQHIEQFIDYCREIFADNVIELNNIEQFERKYRDKTPIWWYTYECFLCRMLNRALRIMDVNIMIEMGFFISDLHRYIVQLHKEQFDDHHSVQVFTVYRGQGLSKIDFEQLMKTKGGLMSFNNFVSTSKDHEVSSDFARRSVANPDLVGILFVMTIDPSKSTTSFASINDVSYFQNTEDDVLFSMYTVFRIREIKPMGETDRLWQVDLTLTNDNDQELCALTESMREETYPEAEGWDRLGRLLLKMGQSEKAQQVYEVLLGQTTNDHEKANIYNQLGQTKFNQGEYKKAVTYFEKSHEICGKIFPGNHPDLASSYNNIGVVYEILREYLKALSSYEKALEIRQIVLSSNHPDLAVSYSNIGAVYDDMGEYSKALSSYKKALEIFEKTLPSNHPDLAASYNNIGAVHYNMGKYSKALSYYKKTHEIDKKSLRLNHPDLGDSYNNIGLAYEKMGEYSTALSFYERAVDIAQRSLPSNHPDLRKWRKNLELVKKKL